MTSGTGFLSIDLHPNAGFCLIDEPQYDFDIVNSISGSSYFNGGLIVFDDPIPDDSKRDPAVFRLMVDSSKIMPLIWNKKEWEANIAFSLDSQITIIGDEESETPDEIKTLSLDGSIAGKFSSFTIEPLGNGTVGLLTGEPRLLSSKKIEIIPFTEGGSPLAAQKQKPIQINKFKSFLTGYSSAPFATPETTATLGSCGIPAFYCSTIVGNSRNLEDVSFSFDVVVDGEPQTNYAGDGEGVSMPIAPRCNFAFFLHRIYIDPSSPEQAELFFSLSEPIGYSVASNFLVHKRPTGLVDGDGVMWKKSVGPIMIFDKTVDGAFWFSEVEEFTKDASAILSFSFDVSYSEKYEYSD